MTQCVCALHTGICNKCGKKLIKLPTVEDLMRAMPVTGLGYEAIGRAEVAADILLFIETGGCVSE